jgi:hypothetical protein
LTVESELYGLVSAIHLSNALVQEGHIPDLGSLQHTVKYQGDKSSRALKLDS